MTIPEPEEEIFMPPQEYIVSTFNESAGGPPDPKVLGDDYEPLT